MTIPELVTVVGRRNTLIGRVFPEVKGGSAHVDRVITNDNTVTKDVCVC